MRELFNIDITDIDGTIIILSAGILTFATLSVVSKTQRSSIIHFLCASLFLLNFIMIHGNVIIGIAAALGYLSMCPVLLLIAKSASSDHRPFNKTRTLTFLSAPLIALALTCGGRVAPQSIKDVANQCAKTVGGVTLLITILFTVAFAGISFLVMRRNSVGLSITKTRN
ncbi:MAG: hypothetical protein LBJ42_01450 [Holosporales bacterium]|nr:hypothetical protein [Holosporales bacterium]